MAKKRQNADGVFHRFRLRTSEKERATPTELVKIKTRDGVPLCGMLFEPRWQDKSTTTAIWLPGLTDTFYGNLPLSQALAEGLNRHGISFAVFNTRGSAVAESEKVGPRNRRHKIWLGAAFEKFEDCVHDIKAMLSSMRGRGYGKIFLLGHSTGANKAVYYLSKTGGRGLSGVGLLGPISDIPGIKKGFGRKLKVALTFAGKETRAGRDNNLIPAGLSAGGLWSAKRLLSVATAGKPEDTFPYYDKKRRFYWASGANLPICVLIGGKDQHADRPVKEIYQRFQKEIPAPFFSGEIIKNADHGFRGKEKGVAKVLLGWIERAAAAEGK